MKLYQKFLTTSQFKLLIETLDRIQLKEFQNLKTKIRLQLIDLIFNKSLYLKETFVPYVEIHKIIDNFIEDGFSKSISAHQIKLFLKYLKSKLKEISKNGLIQI